MLSRVGSRAAKLASRPTVMAVRHDSHYDGMVANSNSLSGEEIMARMQKDIDKRDHARFRYQRMGFPWSQTYVVNDGAFEYVRGGIPGSVWMLIGCITCGIASYQYYAGRFFDPYIHQHNPQPDLDEYYRIQARLKDEPDFWNWKERDAAAESS